MIDIHLGTGNRRCPALTPPIRPPALTGARAGTAGGVIIGEMADLHL
jgi:hypothetical protein